MSAKRLRDLERRRAHNERMRKAGEEFSKMLDGVEERKRETAALIFGALGKRYGLDGVVEEEGDVRDEYQS